MRPVTAHALCWLGALGLALSAAVAQAQGGGDQPPPEVRVTTVELGEVPVREEYAGRVRGAREVQVRARVEGVLEARAYTEGEVVEEGQRLFRIDSDVYEAAVEQAEAEAERARASLRQARRDWERIQRLYEQDAVSTRERDEALSALELAEAEVSLAEARVRSARIELDYTDVVAPVSGITSLEEQPEGSLLSRGDLLTTITQLHPVHVRFALPEEDALAQRRAREALSAGRNGARRAVLILPDGRRYERAGEVDFTEASIDPRTGTVQARAVFPNPDRALTPGLFARVELRMATLENVAVLPERAIGADGEDATVYVVDDEDRVAVRAVELGPVVAEGQVVAAGLEAGDRVVVSGLAGLADGDRVEVAEPSADDAGADD